MALPDLYDTASLRSIAHFNFPARIVDADMARMVHCTCSQRTRRLINSISLLKGREPQRNKTRASRPFTANAQSNDLLRCLKSQFGRDQARCQHEQVERGKSGDTDQDLRKHRPLP